MTLFCCSNCVKRFIGKYMSKVLHIVGVTVNDSFEHHCATFLQIKSAYRCEVGRETSTLQHFTIQRNIYLPFYIRQEEKDRDAYFESLLRYWWACSYFTWLISSYYFCKIHINGKKTTVVTIPKTHSKVRRNRVNIYYI